MASRKNARKRPISPRSEKLLRRLRSMLIESLERREVMAGVQLIGIQPNDVGLFDVDNPYDSTVPANNTLDVAPQQLTFRFDATSPINGNTLSGIQIFRTGYDQRFDVAYAASDLGTAGSATPAILDFEAVRLGASENGIKLVFTKADLGPSGLPVVSVTGQTINVQLNNNAAVTSHTTAQGVIDALNQNAAAKTLVKTTLRGGLNAGADMTTFTAPLTVQLGGANVPKASTSLGAAAPLELRLTAINAVAGQPVTIGFYKSALGTSGVPQISVVDKRHVYVTLDTTGNTTAQQLVTALNSDPVASLLFTASLPFGSGATPVAATAPAQTVLMLGRDEVITPGYRGFGTTPREVITRFAETLPDDLYRIEIYSQDNATAGQTALRNNLNQAFTPTLPGLDRDIVEFNLNLGPQVVAVVPQPVSRNSTAGGGFAGIDTSRRNQIDVYFNEDDLLDGNTSAEKPQFYKLIYTSDTVRNTDDTTYTPTSVSYDPVANRATLTFAQPIDQLGSGAGTFRLRIGTDEPTPSAPNTVTPAGDAGSSFTTADATSLGVAGVLSGTNITSTIITSTISTSAPAYTLDYPGAEDEPGHREIQPESHYINGPDVAGIPTQAYNFQSAYGTDPFGNTLNNQITDEQKQRAREIFELYSRISGIRFYETAASGYTIVTGDLRALDPTIPTGVGGILGLADNKTNRAVMDALEPWSDEFGGDWMSTAFHEIGHLLGMKHTYDLPDAIQGDINGTSNGSTTYAATAQEQVWPLDGDVVHMQYLYRPEVRDVDMYKFTVPVGTTGSLAIETFADRLQIKTTANGILDTQLRLYHELPDGTRELIAQNDDYFGDDSFIGIDSIEAGNYFIGVTAKGTEFDPKVADSGLGGQSEGKYELRVNFRPAATTSIVDAEGSALDGDGDGVAGGIYDFWFRAETSANTFYVDKSAPNGGTGTAASPYNNLNTALTSVNAFAVATKSKPVVRVIGNPGADNDLSSVGDNQAYEIGIGPLSATLSDGATLEIPKDVVMMVDAGAIFKVQGTRIGIGSTTTSVDRSRAALQVLGTPEQSVIFTAFNDESIGVDTSPLPTTADAGNWGGLDFREDLDRAQGRFTYDRQGIFLNYVNHADMRYGGGRVDVASVTQVVNPINMVSSRVTATFNTITRSADAALAATPDSFEETNFNAPRYQAAGAFTPDYDRVGPEVHGNRLVTNSTNGMFVHVTTPSGGSVIPLTVAGRFDDTDVVHVIGDNLTIKGNAGGPIMEAVSPPVNLVTLTAQTGGSMAAGSYSYRVVNIDANGNEGVASAATSAVTVAANGRVLLGQLPPATGEFVGRRIYRALGAGAYALVAEIDKSSTTYTDSVASGSGALLSTASHLRPRTDASLTIDPGTIVKFQGGRIEAIDGGNLIAEGDEAHDIIFTSRSDDRYGGSGTFDTNNDDAQAATETSPQTGDWGGLFIGHASSVSLDHVLVTYAGGVVGMEGDFAGVNPLEIHQADARVTNSTFESNGDGQGGSAAAQPTRFGRGSNSSSTIFVRGAQPVIANNIIRNNNGAAISINANSLTAEIVADQGRQSYPADRIVDFRDNQGPFVRGNKLQGNGTNGMDVRGEMLNVEGVWDDTDIVHVLRSQIYVPDYHTYGGLRLHSSPTESLVVKLQGASAGLLAGGRPRDITDRIGGTVQVMGQPGFPVIMTSLLDDSVGAGFQPDGSPQTDTNGGAGAPAAGNWGGLTFDQFSNDRNVAIVLEREASDTVAPGINSTTSSAQYLGQLATDEKSSDENLRLGFEVHGVLSQPNDVDVYSFDGFAGTEVWFDIDRTSIPLNSVIELVDNSGNILARSNDSTTEKAGGALPFVSDPVTVKAYPMPKAPAAFGPVDSIGGLSKDTWTTNPYDAGLRVTLPGTVGEKSTFHVRVSSNGGLTSGVYQLQVRIRETDEFPGSTVQFADIRYATNGITLSGVPYHSPLLAEASEGTGDNNSSGGAQDLGNLLSSDRAVLSVGGNITTSTDIDFYRVKVAYDSIQRAQEGPAGTHYVATTFDVDYSDGFSRGDLSMWVFDATGKLVAIGRDSNVAEDQPKPLNGLDTDDLSRGTAGKLDPFIGPIDLLENTAADEFYRVAVTSNAQIPTQLEQFLVANPTNTAVRLEPISVLDRIAEDHIDTGRGGTNPATANAPQVDPLLDNTGVVPYHLGDVVLFVSTNSQIGGGTGAGLVTIDPFTGALETTVGSTGIVRGDIALRPDTFGTLWAFSANNPGANDGNSGNFLSIDPGTGAANSTGDDGIQTFTEAACDTSTSEAVQNVGVQFNAMMFTGATGTNLFAIGSRAGFDQTNCGPVAAKPNVLYQFNAATGAAVSNGGGGGRAGLARLNGAGTDVIEIGEITGVGAATITGMTRMGGTTYVVTNGGGLYTLAGTVATLVANFPGANFGGITTGPAAVEGGYDTDTLFAISTTGVLYAFNGAGAPRRVFADNQSQLTTGVTGANGLAFSNLTRNLWQTTTARQGDAGHGISVPLDKTRDASSDGGSSFHFGLPTSQGYNYPGGAHGTLVSNPFSLKGYDATDKPMLYFNYFLATEPDDQDYSPGARTQPDSFRVFVAGDDGNWTLLATNDSYQSSTANDDEREYDVGDGFGAPPPAGTGCGFPSTTVTPCVQELFQRSNAWRQARISLERFAGQENLRLRFDFATAGSLSVGNISTTGEELRAVSANKLRDSQTITISGNAPASATFEVDLGPTLVVPSGARIDGGGSFTVTGPGGTRTFTLTAAATAGLNIQVNTGRTAEDIANDIALRVNAAAIGVNAVVTDGIRVNLSNLVSNVTVSGVVGMPANFVDGAAGVTAGNVALRIRADMTAAQVAAILRTAMANTFAGGNLNSIKSHQDLIYMIRHSVTAQNPPAGATAFGLEVSLPGDSFGEADETASSLTKMGAPSGSVSRRGQFNANEGAYIDDLIIGFAERGEMVTNAQNGAAGGMNFRDNLELSNANLPSKHTETLVGEYQLEVRRNSDFWMDNPFGPSPPRVFVAGIDTNDRVNQSVTLTAPAGSEIFDGQTFVISDGVNSLTFEFEDLDLPGGDAQVGVTSGRVQVGFRPAFTDDQVAEAIRDAVNSNAVQGILKLVASQDDGTVTGTKSTGNRIHLYGPAVSDTQGHTNTFGLTATVHNWYGDSNSVRDQGQVLIYSNLIRDSLNWGVQIDNGARDRTDLATLAGVLPHPGAPIKFDDLNSERLAPGAVLENNVLVRGGQGGIKISGDNTNAPNNDAAVPFVRVVNNTIFGTRAGDAGIWVEQYASPTLLNNIVANLGTGIRVIPDTSTNTTVIGGTIYQNNNFNVLGLTIGSFPILLGAAAPLFVNSAADNFYLAAASLAIDSSLGSLQDRNDYKTRVKQPLGIAASPIIAPDHDITGQLRYDDPTINTPSSQGTDVYIDRGAYDRNDFNGPFAELVVPKDNDSEGRDVDATLTVVQLDDGVYSSFDIVLKDGLGSSTPVEGTGIDQSTVNTNNVLVYRDGKALTPSVDYIIGFQAGSNLLRITPLSGVWRNDAAYVVTLSGIRDKAGNLLQPNQADGATRFTILMPGVDLDYGDLQGDNPPTLQQFPTLFTGNGARHVVYDNDTTIYLGRFVDTETDAAPNVLSNGDDIVVGPTIASITSPTSLAVDTTASNGHLVWNSGTGRLTIGAVVDGDGFAITNRGVTVSFVLDSDGREPAAPTIVIPFNVGDSTSTIADKIVEGLNRSHVANIVTGAGLSIAGQNLAGDVKITADSDDDSLRIGGDLRIPLNPYTNTTPLSIVASGSGYLDAWFDWNGDGDWADPSERYFFSQALVNGINSLNIVVPQASRAVVAPTAGQPGFRDIAARFRYSQSGGLTTDNISVGGEVEDYLLRLYGGRPPVPANDSYTVFEDNTLTTTDVTGATTPGSTNDNSVLSNGVDTDADGDAMRVFLVTPPQHAASFTLNPDGTFTYVPLTNYNGVDTFVYRLRDMSAGQLVSNTFGTATITVREVNDAPIAYNDLPTPTTLTTPEDPTGPAYYTFNSNVLVANDKTPFGDPSYTAPAGTVDDESAQTLKVSSLWDGAAKVLSVTTAKGGTITLSGLGGTLTYQPPADFNQDWNPGGGDDSFIYFVQDNGTTGGAADPLDSVAPATAFIRVTAVNDPPVVLYNANPVFPVVPTLAMNEDDPAGATFGNEVTIADPDLGHGEPVDNVSVTLTVAHGTINVVNVGALGTLSSNGTANVTMTGSRAAVNAALTGMVFHPDLNYNSTIPGTTAATVAIKVDDLGNNGGGSLTDTETVTITVNAVNDDPVNTIPLAVQLPYEDVVFTFSAAGGNAVSVGDVDVLETIPANNSTGAGVLEITLTAGHGVLSLSQTTGLLFSAGDGTSDATMTFRGVPVNINAALAGMTYLTNLDFNGVETIVIKTDDLGNTGAGGAKVDTDTINVNVQPVNDAPRNQYGGIDQVGVQTRSVNEDTDLVFSGATQVGVADVDVNEGTGKINVSLAVTNGKVTLGSIAGLDSVAGDGTNSVVLQGSIANVNAALNNLVFRGNQDFNGNASIVVTTNDLGNFGSVWNGTAWINPNPLTDTDTISITVNAVNDDPINRFGGATTQPPAWGINVDEDTWYQFTGGTLLDIIDVDVNEGTGNEQVTLSVSNGWLCLTDTTGLTFSTGSGQFDSTMTFVGQINDVNNALANLWYLGFTNYNSNYGLDYLSITTNDLGNTGLGGPKIDNDTVTITVKPMNDGPLSALPGDQFVNEDTTLFFDSLSGNAITVSDVDVLETTYNPAIGSGVLKVTVAEPNSRGTINIVPGFAPIVSGDGTGSVTLYGTPAQINSALEGMSFKGNLNYNGTASLVVTIDDLGNSGDSSTVTNPAYVNPSRNTVTINVAPVNDAPVNLWNGNATFPSLGTVSMLEDSVLTFNSTSSRRISVSDIEAGSTGTMNVTLTAANGVITLPSTAGLTFITGDGTADPTMTFTGTVTTINSRLNGLTFRPDANFDGLASITVVTNDRGTTGLGGPLTDTDVVPITVNPVNDAPSNIVPTSVQVVAEDTALVFSLGNGNAIQVNDDAQTDPVEVTLTATNGALTLSTTTGLVFLSGSNGAGSMQVRGGLDKVNAALAGLQFLGNQDFNGTATIVILANDLGNRGGGTPQTDTDTVTVTVSAVNDPPRNLFNGGLTPFTAATTDEDPVTFSSGNGNLITMADVDAGTAGIVRMSLDATDGVITLNGRSGLTFTVGDGTADASMSFSGTMTSINAALNGVSFRPNDYFSGIATMTITANDNGLTGAGGIQTDVDVVSITVVAVNDPPVITLPATQAIDEDVPLVLSSSNGNRITVADDAVTQNLPIQVVLTATGGTVTLNGLTGLTVNGGSNGGASVSVVGLVADLNAALNGLQFTPTNNFNGTATIEVTALDNGNAPFDPGNPGGYIVSNTLTVTIAAVNDAPVATLPAGPLTVTEDPASPLAFGSGAFSVADVDAGASSMLVTLSAANGALTLSSIAGLTFTAGTGSGDATMSFTGTTSAINSALNTLSFRPTIDFNGNAVVSMTVNDQGNTGTGGAKSDTKSVTINVTAVNDAPVNLFSGSATPATQLAIEDTAFQFKTANGNAISISDDAGTNPVRVTLTATNGLMTLNGTTGLTLVAGTGTGDSSVTVEGTIANINTALDGLTYQPNSNFAGDATITVLTSDLGNTGTGGVKTDSDVVTVTVQPRNDGPVNTAPATQSVPEDLPLVFNSANGNQIAIDDIDAGANPVRVSLTSTNGTVTLSQLTGLNFTTGDGTSDATMTFTGTVASINAALSGMRYVPTAEYSGPATLVITTNDQGNTGAGGAQQDNDTVSISVTSVNDPPITAPLPRSTSEDTALTVAITALMTNDLPGPSNEASQVLTFSGVNAASANGGTVAVVGSTVVYTPAANFNGTDTFTYAVTDNGQTNGVADPKTSLGTVTVTVTPVNDAPVAVNDSYVMDEDTTITRAAFNGVRANDSDVEGSPLTVTRVSGPNAAGSTTNGTLTLGADGSFTYVPPANYFGTVTFTYRVSDGALNSNIATVTITVNNVNEPPVAVNDTASTSVGSSVLVNVIGNDTDSDGTISASTVTIVANPSRGTVTVNPNGTVLYTPSGTNTGSDSFQYTVRDNSGAVSNAATVSLTIGPAAPAWQNPTQRYDVNKDGFVSPIDVLLIVNELNVDSLGIAPVNLLPTPAPNPVPFYYDVNGDGYITPNDALIVVLFINTGGAGEGEGADLSGAVIASDAASFDASIGYGAVSPTIEPVSTKRRVIEVPVLFAESTQVGPGKVDGPATKGSAWDSLLDDLASMGDAADATDAALATLWDD